MLVKTFLFLFVSVSFALTSALELDGVKILNLELFATVPESTNPGQIPSDVLLEPRAPSPFVPELKVISKP